MVIVNGKILLMILSSGGLLPVQRLSTKEEGLTSLLFQIHNYNDENSLNIPGWSYKTIYRTYFSINFGVQH